MIPKGRWSCETKPKKFDYKGIEVPDELFSEMFDVKLGPENLADSRERVDKRFWMASVESGDVKLYRANGLVWDAPVLLFSTVETITDISLGFDALGQAVIFYAVGTTLKLWYFNSQLGQLTTKVITNNGRTPIVDFDYRSNTSEPTSDVTLFYVEGNSIYTRIQREVYDIPKYTGVTQLGLRLLKSGMSVENRYQVLYTYTDLRDGSNNLFKVLETDRPILDNMKGNNFELKFTIAKPVTRCVLEGALKKAYDGSDPWYTNEHDYTQYQHVIVEHSSTPEYTSGSNDAELFSLRFMRDSSNAVGSYENIILALVGGGYGAGLSRNVYHYASIPYSVLETEGDYILRFTNVVPDAATPWLDKRVEFIKNGVAIFDALTTDKDSFVGSHPVDRLLERNRLRFGGTTFVNTNLSAFFYWLYPAVFTNISVKVNNRTVLIPRQYSDVDPVKSSPVGTTLKMYRQGDAAVEFYNINNLNNNFTYAERLAASVDIMDYLKEAVNP